MKRKPNIIEAIRNRKLFGALFDSLDSWFAWLVFLKAVFGLDMDARELEVYRKCTGRTEPPKGGTKESYAIVGRRGGKSRIVSFAGVFIGCFFDFRKYLAPGEIGWVLILARDKDQAKVVFNYIGGIIKSIPALKQMVNAWRQDEIELNNGLSSASRHRITGPCVASPLCAASPMKSRSGTARVFLPTKRYSRLSGLPCDHPGGKVSSYQLTLCKVWRPV